jgi:hypothetical protein
VGAVRAFGSLVKELLTAMDRAGDAVAASSYSQFRPISWL